MSQTQNVNLFRKPKQGLWELKYLFRMHQNIRNALELKRRRNDRVEPWEFFSGKFTAPGFMDTVNFRKVKYFQIILSNQNLCNLLYCNFTRLEAEFLKLISVFLEVKVKRFDGWASSPCRVVCSSVLEKGFWIIFSKTPDIKNEFSITSFSIFGKQSNKLGSSPWQFHKWNSHKAGRESSGPIDAEMLLKGSLLEAGTKSEQQILRNSRFGKPEWLRTYQQKSSLKTVICYYDTADWLACSFQCQSMKIQEVHRCLKIWHLTFYVFRKICSRTCHGPSKFPNFLSF